MRIVATEEKHTLPRHDPRKNPGRRRNRARKNRAIPEEQDTRSTTFARQPRFLSQEPTTHTYQNTSPPKRRHKMSSVVSLPRDRRFRKVRTSQTDILGPGAYSPSFDVTKTSAPSCTFSTSSRSLLVPRKRVGQGGPGPVANLNFVRARSTAAVFGSATRRTLPQVAYTVGPSLSADSANATAKASPAYSFAGLYRRPPRATKGRTLMRMCSPIFGYRCNVEEHLEFGRCLDGKCGQRAPWERRRVLVEERGGGERGSDFLND